MTTFFNIIKTWVEKEQKLSKYTFFFIYSNKSSFFPLIHIENEIGNISIKVSWYLPIHLTQFKFSGLGTNRAVS